MLATVNASPLLATYGTEIDRESAREILAAKMNAAAAAASSAQDEARLKEQYEKEWKEASRSKAPAAKPKPRTSTRKESNPIDDVLGSRTGQTVVREVLRGIFSTLKKG